MNILLFSMPDSFEHMPPIAVRMPNGALTSLAGNIDSHHRAAAADLLLAADHIASGTAGGGEVECLGDRCRRTRRRRSGSATS
jgi:hypothetical protein